MRVLMSALAATGLAGIHWHALAAGVPNPAPAAPPGLSGAVHTLLAWWKWIGLIAGCSAWHHDGDRPAEPLQPGR